MAASAAMQEQLGAELASMPGTLGIIRAVMDNILQIEQRLTEQDSKTRDHATIYEKVATVWEKLAEWQIKLDKIPDSPGEASGSGWSPTQKLNYMGAKGHIPTMGWTGDGRAHRSENYKCQIATWLEALDPQCCGEAIFRAAENESDPIGTTWLNNNAHESDHLKELNGELSRLLRTRTAGEAKGIVNNAHRTDPGMGFRYWQALARWFKPRHAADSGVSFEALINPDKARSAGTLRKALENW